MPPEAQDSPQLLAILRSVKEAIIATDAAGQITLLNPAAERLFDVPQARALGYPLSLLNNDLGRWLERASKDSAQPLVFDLVEFRADKDYSAALAPVPDEGGQNTGWVITLQDVTHHRRAEQWKMQAIQEVTHDLRNPLNSMQSAINLLNDLLDAPTPDQQECVKMIRDGLSRTSKLIEQAINLNHVSAPAEPTFGYVSLSQLLEKTVAEFRLAAQAKNLALEFDTVPTPGVVLGDAEWLGRAVSNLLNNAVKYTPSGGRVRVRYREADGQALCEMTDNGPGISPAAQSRLFERFYRVPGESTRRASGSGLGLAITKAIIERHAGRVWVSSEEGRGSTFGFTLPVKNE
jgi:PAS domain S-box-containing protein